MQIVVEEPGQPPRTVSIAAPVVTVGRDERNALVVRGPAVSGFHCELRVADGGLRVRDLGSRNGTAVLRAGARRAESLPAREYQPLEPGDALLLGAEDAPVRLVPTLEAARSVSVDVPGGGRTIRVSRPVAEVTLDDVEPAVWQSLVRLNRELLAAGDVDTAIAAALATVLELVPTASHARVALFAQGARGAGEVPAVGRVLESGRGDAGPRAIPSESMSKALTDQLLLGRVVRDQVGLVWTDVGRDAPPSRSLAELDVRSVAAAPLRVGTRTLGICQIDARGAAAGALARRHLDRLLVVAGPLAFAIRNAESLRKVRAQRDRLASENRRLEAQLGLGGEPRLVIGDSPAMVRVRELVERVAGSDLPVLVTGETGTGKELLARLAHAHSGRAGSGAFVATNVATLPESLVEAELFGAVRGAYTGADADRKGLFEAAHGGTLFLDEVGELPRQAQAALLRVLQEGELRRVGDVQTRRVDVRVVAATNRDLEAMVREGTFREDLLYRLNTVTVVVPPLRDRREDIPLLIDHLLQRAADKQGRELPALGSEARRLLGEFHWPGNVRQLENELARAVALTAEGAPIEAGALSPGLRGLAREDQVMAAFRGDRTLKEAVDAFSREYVRAALAAHDGNRTHTAEALGMTRVGLQKLVRRLGLEA